MKQRKTFNKQTEVRPLDKEGEPSDAGNGKPPYLAPQVNVVHVALEKCIAASISPGADATPEVNPYDDGGTSSGDVLIF
jgi:hypothetical protein